MSAQVIKLSPGLGNGAVSVAALNTATNESYTAGARSGMWTASVYKLFVFEVLLLQHQQSGTLLSDYQADAAARMIENSDNDAGYQMFLAVGGNPGLRAGFAALGLTHTVPGRSDPTFTATSGDDCLVLLKNLVTAGPLDERSRAYALHLMRNVQPDQRWGVGDVADRGTVFANKNGWLAVDDDNGPGEDDDGRWITNSVGIVTVGGQQVLMAVLTRHNSDFAGGVRLVAALARTILPAVVNR